MNAISIHNENTNVLHPNEIDSYNAMTMYNFFYKKDDFRQCRYDEKEGGGCVYVCTCVFLLKVRNLNTGGVHDRPCLARRFEGLHPAR